MIATHGNAFALALAWERVAQAEAQVAAAGVVLDRIMATANCEPKK